MSGINIMLGIVLFLIVSASDLKHQVQSMAIEEVLTGENITLKCDMKHDGETSWFVLYPEQAPIHIFQGVLKLIDNTTNSAYFNGFSESRFYPLLNRTTWTISMRIDNVSQQDFALYFCMVRVRGEMKCGNLTKLVSAQNSPSEPKTETNNGSKGELWCSLLDCVSLVFVIVSSAFVCYLEKRGGRKRCTVRRSRSDNNAPVQKIHEKERTRF
ncbi:uncharacterized protein LOC121298734 [Polyodon spathula]|uniref:uncharacterized protein LOC121298734 n=1 Tax=Polyodon spathula TaxID=7913 RepID=UPI001B7E7DEA|nr:uncharacterized protein LOC121298734 [Polyodon spathula]